MENAVSKVVELQLKPLNTLMDNPNNNNIKKNSISDPVLYIDRKDSITKTTITIKKLKKGGTKYLQITLFVVKCFLFCGALVYNVKCKNYIMFWIILKAG